MPVERYLYNDYHLRSIKKEKDSAYIESPFKTVLEMRHQEITSEYARFDSRPDQVQAMQEQRPAENMRDEKILAELTGAGTLFNVYV